MEMFCSLARLNCILFVNKQAHKENEQMKWSEMAACFLFAAFSKQIKRRLCLLSFCNFSQLSIYMIIFGCNNLILAMKKDYTILSWTLNLHEKRWKKHEMLNFQNFKEKYSIIRCLAVILILAYIGCPW